MGNKKIAKVSYQMSHGYCDTIDFEKLLDCIKKLDPDCETDQDYVDAFENDMYNYLYLCGIKDADSDDFYIDEYDREDLVAVFDDYLESLNDISSK